MKNSFSADTREEKERQTTQPWTCGERVGAFAPLAMAIALSLAIALLITSFEGQIEALKGYGYLGAFLIGFLGNATVILPAPSLAFTTALGGVLDPLLVGVTAGAGEALGELTGYLAGVTGKRIVQDRPSYDLIQGYMDRFGGWVIFVLAAIPNPLFDLAGLAAGVMRFPVWKFLLAAWFGKTLKAVVFAGLGRQLFN
jgi:membrane protein YqaA with SNARE-associated domain